MTTPTTAGGAVLPNNDPHSHWIQSADGLSSRNPAPDASAPWVPTPYVVLKVGNEFAAYHPQASHVAPSYRDGWNHCLTAAQAEIDALRAENERLKSEMQERALQALCDDGQWMEETGRLHAELERKSEAIQRFWRERDALKAALNPPAHTPPTGVFVQAAQDDQARDAGRLSLLETALSEVLEFQSAPEGPHIFDWGRWRRIRDNTPPFQRAAAKETP